MDSIKYFLILEKRLGDYNLIDINSLDICRIPITNDIASIDYFTCKYTTEEIKSSIERGNMAQSSYLDGALKIISDAHHNLKVLTKEIYTEVIEFQNNKEDIDRDFKNKLYGMYKKIVENTFKDKSFIQGMLDRFKNSLKNSDKREIFSILEELPYNKSRNIYISIYEEINKRKQDNLRKLEKLDDVA